MRLPVLALAAALVASPALADGAAPGNDLIGTAWRLQTLSGATAQDVETTLNIRADGIGGRGGCNTYGGGFESRPDGIAFTQVFATLMACAEPAMNQEQNWFAVLEATANYRIEADTLTLLDDQGSALATLSAQPAT
ncbi:MAG: hypothetical protein ABS75_34070 [Pelagibacterium sp. SCN 63-23]|nr:MAG: hypothetical protein ABS75_34070 [Pelagibacterium sp. SCN 63-23]